MPLLHSHFADVLVLRLGLPSSLSPQKTQSTTCLYSSCNFVLIPTKHHCIENLKVKLQSEFMFLKGQGDYLSQDSHRLVLQVGLP